MDGQEHHITSKSLVEYQTVLISASNTRHSLFSFRSKAITLNTFGSMFGIFDVHQSLFAFYRLKMKEKVAAPQKTGKRQIVRKSTQVHII